MPRSRATSTKLGHQPNGDQVDATNGKRTRLLRYVLDRTGWETMRRTDIELVGLGACLPLFGLGTPEDDAVA